MTDWKIRRAPEINAEITVPGDKSISHRSIMLAAMANGTATITGFLPSEDCLSTMKAFQQLGVEIQRVDNTTVVVHGRRGKFLPPTGDIDCGNSGTTMRLMCGILSAQPFRSRLVGDASLSKRPMGRVIEPLTQMGARITAEGEKGRAPLVIEGGELKGIAYQSPVASAQVKSAILLAGLFARGSTSVTEPEQSRDHTERMLAWHVVRPRKNGLTVSVLGGQQLESRDFEVPGDISSAAFWLVAAAAMPGSHLIVKNVGLNPTRTGILAVLIRMGAHVNEIVDATEGEPRGSVEIRGVELKATTIAGREIPNVIDELPILAVAAALATGRTIIKDAKELRVKETDRIAAIAKNLRAFGVDVFETEDGMEIEGGGEYHGADVESFGDHRIAMACAVLGMFSEGQTTVRDTECVNTSYPGFYEQLQRFLKPGKSNE
ncbi:MAG: 3-phosphoshikimate 1-carboxyvinyltransferase [Verrucomicrobiota bacterium]|jgi:3-phosphoshikimate 1-carboxyvinyltransferase